VLDGALTLEGVTRPAILDLEALGSGADPWGGFRAEGTTLRSDFGVGEPSAMLGDEVRLRIDVEAIREGDPAS